MIIYDKLRLINWHYFLNETVPISKLTFLTGANGTGKSTIIDAMQIVLTGDSSGHNFNKAASEKTGRTLKGYLYGETGEDAEGNIKALRKGNFTSYIVLQFKNDDDSHFTLGIYFDCSTLKIENSQFFYINDEFPSHNFVINDSGNKGYVSMSGKELIEYCKRNYDADNFIFFNTQANYREFLKFRFGSLSDKYFTLFKKAVGFTPIVNISQFITEFVCDTQHNVDISNTQANIANYKKLDTEARKMEVKINRLQEISQSYNEYVRLKNETDISSYVVDRANLEKARIELEAARNELIQNKAMNNEANEMIASLKENIAGLEAEKEKKIAQKVNLPGYSSANAIKAKKDELLNKVNTLRTGYELALVKIKDYVMSYDRLTHNVLEAFNECNLDFVKDPLKSNLDSFKGLTNHLSSLCRAMSSKIEDKKIDEQSLKDFQQAITNFSHSSSSIINKLENELYNVSTERNAVQGEINSVRSGHKPFPEQYINLKDSLLSRLQEVHDDAFVDSYCDLIDITDKTWTNVIEAVLYSNKFNFFVNDDYYEEANDILSDLCRIKGIFNVSLVDAAKLIDRNPLADDNSLAKVIATDDNGAKAYTNYLLGRIKRCRTFKEARESGNGLLPDCTGYHNFSTWYLNPNRYAKKFIGTDVYSDDAYSLSEKLNKLDREFSMLNRINNSLAITKTSSIQVMNMNECDSYIQNIKACVNVDVLLDKIDEYDMQLSEGESEDVTNVDQEIAEIDENIQDWRRQQEETLRDTGSYANIIETLEKVTIPAKTAAYEVCNEIISKHDRTFVDNTGEPYFVECYRQQRDIEKVLTFATVKLNQSNSRMRGSSTSLTVLRNKYNSDYQLNYRADDLNTNKEYDDELNRLSGVELPKYIEDIKKAHDKAINEARDDFLYKLRNCIGDVQMQIADLNAALDNIKFGRDSYHFSVAPNRDYADYYNMIMDDLVLKSQDPDNLFEEKYSKLLGDLIDLITSVSDENNSANQKAELEQKLDKFTDYRTYLVFDLQVKSEGSEFTASLDKTFRKKSGGETQTPFYISILASFAQLYRTKNEDNNDTLRLVIFDEAFSKMDAVRIKESVNLLRNFGLQVILSTPSEKVANLANEVDCTLVVHHDSRRRRSYISRHESKEKTYI